jgi:hypothetical protein
LTEPGQWQEQEKTKECNGFLKIGDGVLRKNDDNTSAVDTGLTLPAQQRYY